MPQIWKRILYKPRSNYPQLKFSNSSPSTSVKNQVLRVATDFIAYTWYSLSCFSMIISLFPELSCLRASDTFRLSRTHFPQIRTWSAAFPPPFINATLLLLFKIVPQPLSQHSFFTP